MKSRFTEEVIAEALSPRNFTLTVLPTEKCNFRCTYCYEDFKIGRMHPAVVSGLKKLISNKAPSIRRFTLSWFGGEPLLATPVVLDVGGHAHEICKKHGINFSAGFTTNGYLLDHDLFVELIRISHNEFQITLDGDCEWHNRTRLRADGKPTFEVIWRNLTSFKRVSDHFSVMLRLHVHGDNIESVKRLYRMVENEFSSDPRFRVYFHKVSDLNPDFRITETVLESDDYLQAIDYITESKIPTDGSQPAISEEHLSQYICYAAKPNSLMIRADGRIGKCTVALNDPRNDIGRLNDDGSIDISNDKLRQWMMGFSDLSEQALGCPLSVMSKESSRLPLDSPIILDAPTLPSQRRQFR